MSGGEPAALQRAPPLQPVAAVPVKWHGLTHRTPAWMQEELFRNVVDEINLQHERLTTVFT